MGHFCHRWNPGLIGWPGWSVGDEAGEAGRAQIVKELECQIRSLNLTWLAVGIMKGFLSKGVTWLLLFFSKHKNGIIMCSMAYFHLVS